MQQQLSPAATGSPAPGSQHHRLYSDTLNSPYYSHSQNPNFNSNFSPVQLPNLDPNSAFNINHYANGSTGVTTMVQSPNIDPNSAFSMNHYAIASTGVSTLVQPHNPDPNSTLNTNHYVNAASSQGAHQLGLTHIYIQAQAAAVAQEPNAIRQQYALNSLENVKTNQIGVPQKRILRKTRPKKIKVVQLFRCEVCKVDCNSESVLQLHNAGNKHKKNLQKLGLADPSVTPAWCEVCKVQVNSNIVLDQHKLGKNHKKNLEKLTPENSNVPPASCEVCQVNFNSKIVLDQHKLGKKHKRNVEKLTPANSSTQSAPAPIPLLAPTSVVSATAISCSPTIESGENPGDTTSTPEHKAQRKKGGSDDLESKKRKVIQGGAAPEAVCMCPVCNVVCNSVQVFKFHLAGKKHTAMMKRRESAAISTVTAL